MGKPYSDKRWSDVPKGMDSGCNFCKEYYGFGKCKHHPDGIPKEKLKQSFQDNPNFVKEYCEYRSQK